MVEIKNFPNNQDIYRGAQDVMRWLYGRTSGVFGAGENAAVSVFDPPRMAVQVSDGTGWLADKNGIGCVWWIDTNETTGSALALDIDASNAVYHRIDRVIVEWSTPNYTDSPVVRILSGVPASNPKAPALTNTSTTRQISLAQIFIKSGATEITSADITDERLDASVCGIVTDFVNIDTSMINAQMTAVLDSIKQQLAKLETGVGVELKKLAFSDVSVVASAFVPGGDQQDYGYRAAIALDGVLSTMIPEIVFDVDDAVSGDFSPVAETYDGGIYIYASSPPQNNITIPTIILWRS